MAAIAANRTELLQIADAVARDKSIDKSVVLHAMEEAMQRAAKARYGSENEIRVEIEIRTLLKNRADGGLCSVRRHPPIFYCCSSITPVPT